MGMMYINGVHLNVEIKGEGQPLILVHGLGADHTQWDNEVNRLSNSFKTIAYDCRGHGKSDKPKRYTLDDHVQDTLSLMDALNLESVYLHGVSMGSYIAQGVAVRLPHRIRKLILTVPKSNGLTSSTQRLIQEHAEEFEGLDADGRALFFMKHMAYNPETLLKHPELFNSGLTPAQTEAANQALEGFDFWGELPEITAETLVISGKHDGMNPPSEGELCASLIPNSKFVIMPYSGHIPMVEEPEAFSRVIDAFLGV